MRVQDFLRREGLRDPGSDEDLVAACLRQMEKGAPRGSSLLMEHSGFLPGKAPEAGTQVLLIDAGGTNLRIARGCANGQGGWNIGTVFAAPLPGAAESISAEDFFSAIAEAAIPFAQNGIPIGFCFSYTLSHLPGGDAKLLSLAKQVQIPGLEGQLLGKGLARALRVQGGPSDARVTVLNDAVAVLLAGHSADAALIMGTGVNFALFSPDAVNVEASRYDGFPRAQVDLAMDEKTSDPGAFPLEKSVAGRYLGDLVRTEAQRAAKARCFSPGAARKLFCMSHLSTRRLSEYLESTPDGEDALAFREIADAVLARAARRLAIFAAATLEYAGAKEKSGPAVLQMEGSTIAHFGALRYRFLEYLEKLAGKRGFTFETRQEEQAVHCGTAAAACRMQEVLHG